MQKGFLFNTPNYNIFLVTSGRRTDAAAAAVLDIIGELYHSNPDTLKRAKTDRATLEDVKKRMQPATMTENGTRRSYSNKAGRVFMDTPAGDPAQIIRTL